MTEENNGKKILRPEGGTYFVFLLIPAIGLVLSCYAAYESSNINALLLAALLFCAAVAILIGLTKTNVEVTIDSLTVRTFFSKPKTFALSSIRAVEQTKYVSNLPVALRLVVARDGSAPEVVTIPAKWYGKETVAFLLSFLEAE